MGPSELPPGQGVHLVKSAILALGPEAGVKRIKQHIWDTNKVTLTSDIVRAVRHKLDSSETDPKDQPRHQLDGEANADKYNSEDKYQILKSGIRYDESRRRLLPGDSHPMPTVITVSHSDDGAQFSKPRLATCYGTDYIRNLGIHFEPGPRDVLTFTSQQYGYSRITIEHVFIHNDRKGTSTYANTSFDVSLIKRINCHKFSKSQYVQNCDSLGVKIRDCSQESIWLIDVILSTQHLYFSKCDMIIDTPAGSTIPSLDAAIRSSVATMKFDQPYARFQLFCMGCSKVPESITSAINLARKIAAKGPYKDLMAHAVGGTRLPSLDHMLHPAHCAFRTPDAEVYQFKNREERCVRLAYAAREEAAFGGAMVALAQLRPQKAFAIDVKTARVHHPVTGKEHKSHCMIVIPQPSDLDLFPAIGESACILTNITVVYEEEPAATNVTEKQVINALADGICKAVSYSLQSHGDHDTRHSYILAELDKLVLRAKDQSQERDRSRFIVYHSEKLCIQRSRKDDDGTCYPGEDFGDHRQRVEEWVRDHLNKLDLPKKDTTGHAEFTATRVQPLNGLEGSTVFHAEYPHNPLWRHDPKPYVDVDLHFVPVTAGSNIMDTYNAKPSQYRFDATVQRSYSESTLEARLAGIARATPSTEVSSTTEKYLTWLLDFSREIVPYDLFDLFNSLAHLRDRINGKSAHECVFYSAKPHQDSGHVSPETYEFTQQVTFTEAESDAMFEMYQGLDIHQKSLYERLESPAFGDLLVSGCPGSGKSFTAAHLVLLACHSRIPKAKWDNLLYPTPSIDDYDDNLCTRYNPDDSQSDDPEFRPRTCSFSDDELDEQDDGKDSQRFIRATAMVLSTRNNHLDELAMNLHNLQKCQPFRQLIVTRAMAPSRLDQALKAHERTPATIIEDDEIPVDEAFEYGLELELKRLHQHNRVKASSPTSSTSFSVQSRVAALLQENQIREAREANNYFVLRDMDPIGFRMTGIQERLRDVLKTLVEIVYKRSDIIVATPVAANSLMHKLGFSPAIIWIDEAWRMTEPDALIPFAGFPLALIRLQSGDSAQLPPFCATLHSGETKDLDRWVVNQFARQLSTSLPTRAVESGHDVVHLLTNWRATNSLSQWASTEYYAGRMIEGRPEDTSPEMARATEYLKKLNPDVIGSRILFNLQHANETRVGTSFENVTHAVFVRELIASIFANRLYSRLPTQDKDGQLMSIMVISPYSQQVQLLRSQANRLVEAEWVKDLVEFRTVDAAMGSEADIIIYDNPRTSRPGFTAETQRVNVAHTRARKLEFVILPGTICGGTSPNNSSLRSLWRHADSCNAIMQYAKGQWDLCPKCSLKHSNVQRCPKTTCAVCSQHHPVRRCNKAKHARITVPAGCELPEIGNDVYTGLLLKVIPPKRNRQAASYKK